MTKLRPSEYRSPIRSRELSCGCELYSQIHILSGGRNLSWASLENWCGGSHAEEMRKEHP